MNGAAYIRVSTEEQLEYSPDSQRNRILEYALHNNIRISPEHIYTDEGISGRSARNRPAFLQMIADARQKPAPFQVILVWKFSRFARNRQDSILYKSMLRRECGIEVISVSEPLSDDPTSILVEALLEAMDEYYSLNLAGEVRRGMQEKFSRGQTVSVPPFGYRMGTDRFEPCPDTAPFVPVIFQKYADGWPLRKIAAWLNGAGIRTIRGNLFESRSVEYILTNPVYTGKLRRRSAACNGKTAAVPDRFYQGNDVVTVSGTHLPLVSQQLFDTVQKRLALSRTCKFSGSQTPRSCTGTPSFPAAGLIRCSTCGSLLRLTARRTALQCASYSRGHCYVSHYITLRLLEPALFQALGQCPLALSGASSVVPVQSPVPDPEQPSLTAQIREEEKKLERLKRAYAEGIDSLEEYRIRKKEIRQRIRILCEEQKKTEGSVPSRFLFTWTYQGLLRFLTSGHLTAQEQNEVLKLLLSSVVFSRTEPSLQLILRF